MYSRIEGWIGEIDNILKVVRRKWFGSVKSKLLSNDILARKLGVKEDREIQGKTGTAASQGRRNMVEAGQATDLNGEK